MANVDNLTPFQIEVFPSFARDGEALLVSCIAGRFDLPRAGHHSTGLVPSETQVPPSLADVYWGEPGFSSLRYESQATYVRPGTDVYLNGSAVAPAGKPVVRMVVEIRVGEIEKRAVVFGERVWMRGVTGLRPSLPHPFLQLPLQWERSYGGPFATPDAPQQERRNPVGKGFYASLKQATDRPLPNIEDLSSLITNWSDRPAPMGFGPVARSWLPRLELAGTFDEAWVAERAPLWPVNLDERFFNAASPGLTAPRGLIGGEHVVLKGVLADGDVSFVLPRIRLAVETVFRTDVDIRSANLDAVLLETDESRVTLIWRTAVPVERKRAQYQFTVVRELEPGEQL